MAVSLRRRLHFAMPVCAALIACAHADDLRAVAAAPPAPPPSSAPPSAPAEADAAVASAEPVDASAPATPAAPAPLLTTRPPVPDARCPIPIAQPELVVARVGRTRVTACDLALEWRRRTQAGLRVESPERLAQALVRDILMSTRAPMPLPTDSDLAGTLAEALFRSEAAATMPRVDLSDEALSRYAEAHRGQFIRDARLHARALALPTREAAVAAIQALRDGAPLSSLAETSPVSELRRDQGDLGLLRDDSPSGAPAAVTEAARALTRDGEVYPEPIQVQGPAPRRRRGSRGAAARWWVVERIERVSDEPMPEASIRRRVAQRLLRDRYRDALREAETRLRESVAERARAAVIPRALDAVHLAP